MPKTDGQQLHRRNKPTADHVPINLYSSPVGQVEEKSSLRCKSAINICQSKSSFDIVNILLSGQKAI
jgi:hypothetical protein